MNSIINLEDILQKYALLEQELLVSNETILSLLEQGAEPKDDEGEVRKSSWPICLVFVHAFDRECEMCV